MHPYATEIYKAIIDAKVEKPVDEKLRSKPVKERTAIIRKFVKSIVRSGVSVTIANGIYVNSTTIRLPRDEHGSLFAPLRIQAKRKMYELILAAFPDMDDRSDSNSDHFDSVFSVQ